MCTYILFHSFYCCKSWRTLVLLEYFFLCRTTKPKDGLLISDTAFVNPAMLPCKDKMFLTKCLVSDGSGIHINILLKSGSIDCFSSTVTVSYHLLYQCNTVQINDRDTFSSLLQTPWKCSVFGLTEERLNIWFLYANLMCWAEALNQSSSLCFWWKSWHAAIQTSLSILLMVWVGSFTKLVICTEMSKK